MIRTENDTTSPRVHRGGSWLSNVPSWVRAASRSSDEPAGRGLIIGFRTSLAGRTPR